MEGGRSAPPSTSERRKAYPHETDPLIRTLALQAALASDNPTVTQALDRLILLTKLAHGEWIAEQQRRDAEAKALAADARQAMLALHARCAQPPDRAN